MHISGYALDIEVNQTTNAHAISCQSKEVTLRIRPNSGSVTYNLCDRGCRDNVYKAVVLSDHKLWSIFSFFAIIPDNVHLLLAWQLQEFSATHDTQFILGQCNT